MNPRQEKMADYIRGRGVVRLADLEEQFSVSPATVRRDLVLLDEQGRIRRVHGGAVALESRLEEPLFDDKTAIATKEKRRIAEFAATQITRGDTIYLDGGSTVLELARLLVNRTDVTVVTNSLRAAIELSGRGPRLILVGGELRRLSQTAVGPLTRYLLNTLRIDKAFMGTMGLAWPEGLTTSDPGEAYAKELAMNQATHVYVLADHQKAGKVAFARSGEPRTAITLITDPAFPAQLAKTLKKNGWNVETV